MALAITIAADDAEETDLLNMQPLSSSSAWSDRAHRAAHLGPVLLALREWQEWPDDRKDRFANLLASATRSRVLPLAEHAHRVAGDPAVFEAMTSAGGTKISKEIGNAMAAEMAAGVAAATAAGVWMPDGSAATAATARVQAAAEAAAAVAVAVVATERVWLAVRKVWLAKAKNAPPGLVGEWFVANADSAAARSLRVAAAMATGATIAIETACDVWLRAAEESK